MDCSWVFFQGFFRKAIQDLLRFLSNIQNLCQDLECLDPKFDKNYLFSCNSDSSLDRKSLTSCWLESINSAKSSRNPHRTCRIWAQTKSRSSGSNLRPFTSWRSSSNAFWVEWISSWPINSIWALNTQKTLRYVCMGVGDTSLFFEQLNYLRSFMRGRNIFAESASFDHAINFQVILYSKRNTCGIFIQCSFDIDISQWV